MVSVHYVWLVWLTNSNPCMHFGELFIAYSIVSVCAELGTYAITLSCYAN